MSFTVFNALLIFKLAMKLSILASNSILYKILPVKAQNEKTC